MMEELLALLALAGFIIAILAKSQAHRLDSDLRAMRKRLGEVESRLYGLGESAAPPPVESAAIQSSPAQSSPVEPPPVAAEVAQPPSEAAAVPPPPPPPPPHAAQPVARPRMGAEKALTERWLVWLGGLALALGGAFLVKLSVEQGLLGPQVRVALGALAGAGLMAAGHWLKRRSVAGTLPWQVPPVLVGAGGSMMFASIFAAHGLYDMIGQLPAFGALALVAATVAVLSVAHGPYVALLALAGAYAVPLLVHSNESNVIGLFAYLLAVSAALLALLRWREWWWLAWAVLVGSAGWTLLWQVGPWRSGDELVVGGYLIALFGLFAAFRLGVPTVPALAGRVEAPMVRRVVAIAVGVISALALPLASTAHFSWPVLALPLVLVAAAMVFGWFDAAFDRLPWLPALSLLAVLAVWEWPPVRGFAVTASGGAVLFGLVGVVAAPRAARPWVWAAGAAAVPAALLAEAYWQLSSVAPDWGWSLAALLLAALQVAVAERFNRRRAQAGMEAAVAAAATGTVAALALAATFALSEAWLTVALALLVVGVAWVEGLVRVPGLRKVALGVAAIVLVRLLANPSVLDYALPSGGLGNWLIYGYGLPAAAFAWASRLFRRGGEDLLVAVLEAGTVAFATLLVTLEIHVWQGGDLYFASEPGFAERGMDVLAWLAGAAVLFVLHRRGGSRVLLGAGWLLLGLATVVAVLLQALVANPLLTGESVGEGTLFNLLLLGYAGPAALYALLWFLAPERPTWGRPACGGLAIAFTFLWATLQVRHAFAGPRLDLGWIDQAEMWIYSVVWLLGGAGLLTGGILRRSVALRRAGLGVVLVVVAKVFIVDMAQLTGLWRALSFLGLGGVLVAIGGLYRRFARYI